MAPEHTQLIRPRGRFLLTNAAEIVVPEADGAGIERLTNTDLYAVDGRVKWIGPRGQHPADADDAQRIDGLGCAVIPALVDCHTHLVFGGDRVADFARRCRGMTYAEIGAEGGGILTTVTATRETSTEQLKARAEARLNRRLAQGVWTTEIKSGYGLTVEHELRMLEVVQQLGADGWDVEGTLLGAHTVPKDRDREAYVDEVVTEMIPAAAERKLARFVDVFVERGAYTVEEGRRVLEAAKQHGLIPRVHADQITAGGGAELAASVAAASADHLEHILDAGAKAMADANVVAVLLPGAMTYLGDHAAGLGRRLVDAGVRVAVATDMNPGSSPTNNLPLMATIAATQMGLTAEEALRAVTLGGAQALRRDDVGTLAPGARANFVILDHADPRALVASYGEPIVRQLVVPT